MVNFESICYKADSNFSEPYCIAVLMLKCINQRLMGYLSNVIFRAVLHKIKAVLRVSSGGKIHS